MFQRLKGAIDSRIAEEQARQRAAQGSPSRSSSAGRRGGSRAVSPSKRQGRAREKRDGGQPGKSPDPSEFEPEFVIGDDDTASGAATPLREPEKTEEAVSGEDGNEKPLAAEEGETKPTPLEDSPMQTSTELPTEVRVKLRKLDKLESRYQDLLKAYKTAHARVLSIEPFEASLRENTPLTSIAEPGAFIEYLNQVNLKGDMVVDELKRVSTERDDYKRKLEEAERSTREAWDEVTNLKNQKDTAGDGTTNGAERTDGVRGSLDIVTPAITRRESIEASRKSPTPSIASRVPSLSLFSPKPKPIKSPPAKEENEEFFSYDNEIPRLESELKERQAEVDGLKSEVSTLKGDLSVARESTEGMVKGLEAATRELNSLRDSKDRHEAEMQNQRSSSEQEINSLKSKIQTAEQDLEASKTITDELKAKIREQEAAAEELKAQLKHQEDEMKRMSESDPEEVQAKTTELATQLEEAIRNEVFEKEKEAADKRMLVVDGIVTKVRGELQDAERTIENLKVEVAEKEAAGIELREKFEQITQELKDRQTSQAENKPVDGDKGSSENAQAGADPIQPSTGTGKKKNKKKKKAGKTAAAETSVGETVKTDVATEEPKADQAHDPESALQRPRAEILEEDDPELAKSQNQLQAKYDALQAQLLEKVAALERLHVKLKGEEDLREEIETLRDDLLNVGQEHVEAKDKVKELLAEKAALEESVSALEKELSGLRASHTSDMDSDKAYKDLMAEFEDLKVKATTLQTDLSAAQQLAASRFKDLTELREVLQKAQPELKNLRTEVAELTTTNEDLRNKVSEMRRLEARHEDLQSEMKGLRSIVTDRESEIKTLNQKISQETSGRLKVEEALGVAESDLRYSEGKKQEAVESNEKTTKDLANAREELRTSQTRLGELEEQVSQLNRDAKGHREELQLKTAQHASAQSLMGSMRDQTAEMAMQMKEARERCESLEEELGDAHRLLSERSREGETMRRLLADVEGRSDSKVREFKERMDTAIEERDRAEDEASTVGRRRAREIEELKAKARDAERALKRAEEDKEELERAQKDWKGRREELEAQAERSMAEMDEVRKAMGELRDALDDSERQARELEKQKAELRRSVEETQQRLEKLQKSNKTLSDEIRTLQAPKKRGLDSGVQSSRSSIDSTPPRIGVGSPTPRDRNASLPRSETPTGPGSGAIDYVYLKNVLLQFLEQKDKNHQKQLIPVLGMLLHFDRKDEQKWMSAITAR